MFGLVIVAIIFCAAAIGQEFYQGPEPKLKAEPPKTQA